MTSGEPVNIGDRANNADPAAVLLSQASLRSRVFRNTAANIGGRGLALLFSVGATIILARCLGTEGLGTYGAIYAYLTLFAWMATFGFEPILLREISRERESAKSLLRTAMVMSCFLAVGTVAIAALIAPLAGYPG